MAGFHCWKFWSCEDWFSGWKSTSHQIRIHPRKRQRLHIREHKKRRRQWKMDHEWRCISYWTCLFTRKLLSVNTQTQKRRVLFSNAKTRAAVLQVWRVGLLLEAWPHDPCFWPTEVSSMLLFMKLGRKKRESLKETYGDLKGRNGFSWKENKLSMEKNDWWLF